MEMTGHEDIEYEYEYDPIETEVRHSGSLSLVDGENKPLFADYCRLSTSILILVPLMEEGGRH